ncbi:hypothetical protein HMPREF0208_02633 [Citrobacter koseri]|nr:hypothetical protein HMPREF3220_02912 [Citrobacter koseri]KXA01312.1 hypothetical protein HMPREF3207_02938 [Citrobacter koseri]KXB43382.1 hypothetical protein HMPREF0208_02633 [Citrobacter koseri]
MAEIKDAGMFKQIVAALFIRRAINRNRGAHAPAQGEQPLNMIHMIMREQKLLKRSGGPAIGKIVQARIKQRYRVIEFDDAATGAAAILLL